MSLGAQVGASKVSAARIGIPVAVLGVVYGDIGTSPLYAMRESFSVQNIAVTEVNILGVLSLIFWSLLLVISLKYAMFIMRADNDGEGGILALASLVAPMRSVTSRRSVLVILGLFGTALLYGDGMITPSISVLSAVEGLEVATPQLADYVIPISIIILIALFSVQRRGTASVGAVFGPTMVVWFAFLALIGIKEILSEPTVLRAINPAEAARYFSRQPLHGFLSLGSIFLVVTGAEALYADMGHFTRRQITRGWFAIVFPALVLNYFGQGALLIGDPGAIENPFYAMTPDWALYPTVVLATAATVIASQALISGAFSLTTQALRLDYLPRVHVDHTSDETEGQVYVPAVNWALMVASVGLVLGFRSSSALAAAYGIAVATTMVITTILFAVVSRRLWKWSPLVTISVAVAFMIIDGAFFVANLAKIPDGGWFPLLIGFGLVGIMITWRRGRLLVADRVGSGLALQTFVESIAEHAPTRVSGTAVYMVKQAGITPPSLLASLRHSHVLHKRVVIVTVVTDHLPRVLAARRYNIDDLGNGFVQIELHFGFAEVPNVPLALSAIVSPAFGHSPADTYYFVGRETIEATDRPGMAIWRERLFSIMARNAAPVDHYFCLPVERTSAIGNQIDI